MTRGGKRPGAGRPATGRRKKRQVYLFDEEYTAVERVLADELGQSLAQALRSLAAGEWVPKKQ